MERITRRCLLNVLMTFLVIATVLVGCSNYQTEETPPLSDSLLLSEQPMVDVSHQPEVKDTVSPPVEPLLTAQPTVEAEPTRSSLGTLFNKDIDLRSGPLSVPIELRIPVLKVIAPVLGVGL